ncbi:hypothetical protein DBR17_20025 [Sphingomonas sp. HMWF008]|nr:hypothetical protein DBR17_20025 [Sphingomonas sp. HMWF008]
MRRNRRAHHRRATLELATATEIAALLLLIAAEQPPLGTIGSFEARLRLHLRLLHRLRPLELLRTLEFGAGLGRAHLARRTLAPVGAFLRSDTFLQATILRKRRRRDQRRSRHDRGEQNLAHRLGPYSSSGRHVRSLACFRRSSMSRV